MGARVVTVNDVLDGHVVLDIECLDRIVSAAPAGRDRDPGIAGPPITGL
jgi:hypothetical protein